MQIPEGMTENQVIQVIKKIVKRLAPRFTFGYHTVSDIEQEAFIMGLDGLTRYESGRPLENFLSVHISNRLKSFLRDNYFRQLPKCDCPEHSCSECLSRLKRLGAKKNIMNPIDLENINADTEYNMSDPDTLYKKLELSEIRALINKHLPMEFRIDYRKMCDGVPIPKPRKDKIIEQIQEILDDYIEE